MAEIKPLRATTECTLYGQTAAETLDVPTEAHILTMNPNAMQLVNIGSFSHQTQLKMFLFGQSNYQLTVQ